MGDDERNLKMVVKMVEGLSNGIVGREIETSSSKGLKLVEARKGLLRFHFVVPNHLLDQDGNWQAGAIATLMDNLGANAVFTVVGQPNVTVEFSISYFSTAKIQEEVEIEAKVVAQTGKLISQVVEITRKSNGELIAVGKQWMTVKKGHESRL